MSNPKFPDYPPKGRKLITCNISLPPNVRNDLCDVSSYLEVSRSSLAACLLRPSLREMSELISANPAVIDKVLSSTDGFFGTRLRGEAGRHVEHKVWLLSTMLDKPTE